MTNHCYRYDVYNRYRVGDPVKRFAKRPRKMSKIYRLSLKVTVPLANLVLPKIYKMESEIYKMESVIYKMESVMESFLCKIHMMAFQRKSIKRFVHRSVKVFIKLEAPSRVAVTALYVKALLYGCAMIAILNLI